MAIPNRFFLHLFLDEYIGNTHGNTQKDTITHFMKYVNRESLEYALIIENNLIKIKENISITPQATYSFRIKIFQILAIKINLINIQYIIKILIFM